eukprot:CAMPEP_0180669228 /NCGR_PEP_ID=MMETSP1037_2-20121125/63365_1 /TAXON_ID=632150 /ORGANISM="Azadinium spinosum, Strain 3D9" /LENGTH=36 /DNA_ID= /DNA_START= /DNA_END= /DNA_ORIENTATION=
MTQAKAEEATERLVFNICQRHMQSNKSGPASAPEIS